MDFNRKESTLFRNLQIANISLIVASWLLLTFSVDSRLLSFDFVFADFIFLLILGPVVYNILTFLNLFICYLLEKK